MRHLQDRVARALRELGVVPGPAVGVACSGGPDSAVLAHVCMGLARRGGLGPVTLVHVNHGLRPDAGRDAEVVRALAEQGGGRAVVRAASVDRRRASLEAAARDARYAALDAVAEELDLGWVLLAHTASDQAETVLMRLVRGTGVAGLAGIPAARGRYLRPLLGTTREEIEAYRAALAVPAVEDPMNQDPAFFRNRVRHQWLPALRQENPRLDQALCRLAGSAGQEREVLVFAGRMLLAEAGRARVEDAPDPQPGVAGPLDVACLRQAPAPVCGMALAMAVARIGAGPLEARHQRALAELLARPAAGTVELALPGATAAREYDLLFFRAPGAGPAAPEARAAHPPGSQVQVTGPDGPYVVRRWQPGDRMRPARLRGRSRKLSDLFTDARVPRRLRAEAVVVARAADGAIVWVQHIGAAYGSRVSVTLTPDVTLASNKVSD